MTGNEAILTGTESMKDGIYQIKVSWPEPDPTGNAVAIIANNNLRGVDPTCVYTGDFIENGSGLSISLAREKAGDSGLHVSPGNIVNLSGSHGEDDFDLRGEASHQMPVTFTGRWVDDLE